jgi:hypothetical protein
MGLDQGYSQWMNSSALRDSLFSLKGWDKIAQGNALGNLIK